MVTDAQMCCPACDAELMVSGLVLGGGSYTLSDYGPPGTVFHEPVTVEDISPDTCPACAADIWAAAALCLSARAEDGSDA
jgi:hypothetical protein